jgi:integrase
MTTATVSQEVQNAATRPSPAATPLVVRSAPRRAGATVEVILELTRQRIGRSAKYRLERERAVRGLLDWLVTFPGSDWQERWQATGSDTRGEMWGPQGPSGMAHAASKSGVTPLIALEVIRPSVAWLREATPPHMFMRCREAMEPEVFERLQATAETFTVAITARMLAMNMLTIVRIHTGQAIMAATATDFDEVVHEWRKSGRMIHSVPLSWQLLQRAGGLVGETTDPRSRGLAAQRTPAELVACRGVKSVAVAELLVEYLTERSTSVDYTTLVGLARMLVKGFWVDIERHNPGQQDLSIAPEVAAAWKQRLKYLPDGRERADFFVHLMAVRTLYLDIAQWTLTDPGRWARWVCICPIRENETLGQRKRIHRTRARMHQRTRTLAPLLPVLARSAQDYKRWAAAIFEHAAKVPEGQEFEFENRSYRRVIRRSCYSDGAARPSVVDLATGKTLRLHHMEETAFWTWAFIEVFRLTGVRVEELVELTHLSIRRYTTPTGELTAILQIAPSKSDRERVLPVAPELASVLAAIVRRAKGGADTIPAVSRFDPSERTSGPRLPHLFQPNFGGPPQVLNTATLRSMLTAAAARADLRDVDGTALRFTPHDMRRIFATETVNGGLPIHIAQKLLGHLDLNTTQGYVAVYPEQVIQHYRDYVARRRETRPSDEYREPTAEEWNDFQEHFTLRKVALGTCHRPYGTPCVHEHACVRCPMLQIDPAQQPRLLQIEANTLERLDEARSMQWLGEVSALEESLRHIRAKQTQVARADRELKARDIAQ